MLSYFHRLHNKMMTNYRGLDRYLLYSIFILILFGVFLTLAASPAVAERHHPPLPSYHFVIRQFLFFIPAIIKSFY